MYQIRFDNLDALIDVLDPKIVNLASNRALNRVATKASTLMSRSAREGYKIKAADIKKYLRKKNSKPATQHAELIYTSAGLPLSYFNPKEVRVVGGVAVRVEVMTKRKGITGKRTRLSRRVHKGTTIEIKKGRRIKVKGKRGFGGFIAHMGQRHVGVFERKTKKRLPVEELRTLSVSQMIEQHGLPDNILTEIQDYHQDVLAREVSYRFQKAMGLI